MRVQIVVDTNSFVSALRSSRGASFRLLSLVGQSEEFQVNISVPLILEYEAIAKRQLHITGLSFHDVDDIIDYICAVANQHPISVLWRPYLRDPKDDMVLELAFEAQCQYIISYNKRDFAGVEEFGLKVLTAHEFLKMIGELP